MPETENFSVDFEEVTNIGTSDFNQLSNRPKYMGQEMTGQTDIPEVKEYKNGNGLNLDEDTFSVDTAVVALKTDIPEVPTVVQTTGTSTTDVMSQNATTNAIKNAEINVTNKIGDLTNLTTIAKNNIVAAVNEIDANVGSEETARSNADNSLQGQIDALAAASDVTDIVGTYAQLQAYDTQHLKDNNIIKVLQDENQNDETTYYRWSTSTQVFTLIGEEGPYYTKSAADQKFQEKLIAGTNITIDADGKTISSTNTTYSAFIGTDGTSAGTAGLVPAPATTDADKFLKSDGSWDTAGGGGVISLTSADYNYPTNEPVAIALWLLDEGQYIITPNTRYITKSGAGTSTSGDNVGILVFRKAVGATRGSFVVNRGNRTTAEITYGIDTNGSNGSVFKYTVSIIDNLNSTSTVDGLSANQGKVLKGLIDGLVISGAGAPTTSTVGTVGQLYEDVTNGDLYICTDATNPYVWEEIGAGGGGGGDTVYSTKTTSDSSTGGAIYIGDKNSNQEVQADPTTTDNHYKYFWALPSSTSQIPGMNSINILGKSFSGRANNITLGVDAQAENAAVAIGTGAIVSSNGVAIGYNANQSQGSSFNNYAAPIAIGYSSYAKNYGVALGYLAKAAGDDSIVIGRGAECWVNNSIALGKGAYASRQGEVYIGCDNASAFNNTSYRVIGGVHDGQKLHDAATVAQGNTLATSAPTTSTVGVLGQLYTDTTNMHTYQCTAIDDVTDPSNPVYTWTQRW